MLQTPKEKIDLNEVILKEKMDTINMSHMFPVRPDDYILPDNSFEEYESVEDMMLEAKRFENEIKKPGYNFLMLENKLKNMVKHAHSLFINNLAEEMDISTKCAKYHAKKFFKFKIELDRENNKAWFVPEWKTPEEILDGYGAIKDKECDKEILYRNLPDPEDITLEIEHEWQIR